MKKFYVFLALLAAMLCGGVSTALAQNEEVIEFQVNAKTGDWTACNPARTWASRWAGADEELGVAIRHDNGNNNMAFYDGFNIQFFNSIGGSTTNEDYEITCDSKYYITAVSFDFVCANDQGVAVDLYGTGAVENYSKTDPEHVEATDIDPDEEKVVFNVATLGSGTTFANTSNFVIKLVKRTGMEVLRAEFAEVLKQYGPESIDISEFPTGTLPGLYGEAEVDAFSAAVDAGFATDDMPESEITEDLLKKLMQDIKDAYAALIASKVMAYSVPTGYYRLRAAMVYTNDIDTGEKDEDGQPIMETVDLNKYMLAEKSGSSLAAVWGNLDSNDVENQARALFYITAVGDQADNGAYLYDIQSSYHQGRFNNVSTSSKVTMSTESDNLMAIEPAYTDEDEGGITYINIRVATQEPGYNYLHQGGHGGGSGKSGNVVGWNPSFNINNGPAGSEWVLEPVDAAEAEAIMAAYEPVKARQEFEAAYVELRNNAVVALNKAKDFIVGDGVITENEQFSSPWSETSEGSLDNLLDGKNNTFWHSAWSAGSVPNHTHYLQVALNNGSYELLQMTITCRPVANDHITLWSVYGSNDEEAEDEDWVKLAVLETPFGNNTETISAAPFELKGYQNLRFYIDGTTTGRGYGHVSEFQLYEVRVNPTSQYALMGEASKNLDAVLREQENVTAAEVTGEQAAALQAAYDAFILKYVDPAELRQVIADVEGIADGIIIGNNPGYWTDASVANKLKEAVAEAREYDKAGIYVAETSNALIQQLKKEGQLVRDAAIGIQTGKWYRIRFGSRDLFEAQGWDLEAGDAVVNDDEVETDEALWDKYLTVADVNTEDGVNTVVALDAEDVRLGDNIFFDELGDVEDPDMALFRFVAVGDSAYLIQNKATGLFLKAAGTSGYVRLSIHPSLFNTSAIGYGFNLIAARDLNGTKQNYLHAQRLYNALVTWDAYTPGTRSALYLEEAGDVAANYDGSAFSVDVMPGQFYAYCYPVDLSVDEESGVMYTVNEAKGTTVTLAPITNGAAAGRPFLFISGAPEDYDAENETSVATFRHGYEVAAEPNTSHALKGTYTRIDQVGAGYIIVDEHNPNQFVVTRALMGGTVNANTAYIASDEQLSISADITIEIPEDAVDGIGTALRNVSKAGVIYTLDGRVAARGNLNTVSRLPKGVYILNGTKVTVR